MKFKKQTTKEKIIQAAWTLFPEKGYEHTTLHDIIEKSQTSRGAFYHHFRGKEDLLFCLAYFFDADYSDWLSNIDPEMNSLDKLCAFDKYILRNLEDSPYRSFLPQLYGHQVMTEGTRYILNADRPYYQIVATLMKEGIQRSQIRPEKSSYDLTHDFVNLERSFTYNWCLEKFQYSLAEFAHPMMKLYLNSIRV